MWPSGEWLSFVRWGQVRVLSISDLTFRLSELWWVWRSCRRQPKHHWPLTGQSWLKCDHLHFFFSYSLLECTQCRVWANGAVVRTRFRPNIGWRRLIHCWRPVMWHCSLWSLWSWPSPVPTGSHHTSILTRTSSGLVSSVVADDQCPYPNSFVLLRSVGLLFRPLQVFNSKRWPICHRDPCDLYRHPPYQYDEIFHGCHWIYSSKYQNIRDWLQPGERSAQKVQSICSANPLR